MKISEIDADKILLAIGPEGGFTQSEKAALEGLSFIPVNMGKTTLRTVAAAAAAAAVLCM
jgi:RsmE family RNA methyltransferase